MKKSVLAAIILCLSVSLEAEGPGGGVIYGKDWSLAVKPPAGWVMDGQTLAAQGIFGLFYEAGATLDGETPLIYIATNALEAETDEALKAWVRNELEGYVKDMGAVSRALKLSGTKWPGALAYELDMKADSQYETVVYLRYGKAVFLVVLTARTSDSRKELKPKLEELLASLAFSDKVPE